MKCKHCNLGIVDGVNLIRQNKPGEMPAIWCCEKCNKLPVDEEVQEIIDIISGKN